MLSQANDVIRQNNKFGNRGYISPELTVKEKEDVNYFHQKNLERNGEIKLMKESNILLKFYSIKKNILNNLKIKFSFLIFFF